MPDLVLGSSAGALNAVAFASDPSLAGIGRLEATWRLVRRRHVAPLSTRTLLAAVIRGGDGLVPSTALRGLLAAAAAARRLDETSIPAHVVACFRRSELGGRLLVDGSVAADIPVMQAEALGSTVTYVLPAATFENARRHRAGRCLWFVSRSAISVTPSPEVRWLPPAGQCTFCLRLPAGPPTRSTSATPRDGYRLAADWLASHSWHAAPGS